MEQESLPDPEVERAREIRALERKQLEELNVPRALIRSAISLSDDGAIRTVDHGRIYAANAAAQALAKIHEAERAALGIPRGGRAKEEGLDGDSPRTLIVNISARQSPEQIAARARVIEVTSRPVSAIAAEAPIFDERAPRVGMVADDSPPPGPERGIMRAGAAETERER